MAADKILRTYGDSSKEQDVAPLVEILSPKENWLLNNLPKGKVTDTVVSTMTDTLASAGSQAVAESGDYTNLARTTPTLLNNIVELVAIPFRVSRTQREISKYTDQDEGARQLSKGVIEWSNAAEFDLLRSTLTSGASGTTPKVSGIIEATSKSTNHTTETSTTQFTVSVLKGLMQNCWDNSNGVVPTDILVSSQIADGMDDFTAKSQVLYESGSERRLVNAIEVFETGLGVVRRRIHRYVVQAVGTTDSHERVMAINPEYLEIGYLREPYLDKDLQRGGDYDAFAVVGKFTLRVRNQDVHFFADGYKK